MGTYPGRLCTYLQTLDKAGKACRGQNSSLLRTLENYRHKKFDNIGPRTDEPTSTGKSGKNVTKCLLIHQLKLQQIMFFWLVYNIQARTRAYHAKMLTSQRLLLFHNISD